MSDPDRYLLAKTFYTLFAGGAAVVAIMLVSLLAIGQIQGKHTGQISALETRKIIHPVALRAHQIDHDKLIAIESAVRHIEEKLDDLIQEMRRARISGLAWPLVKPSGSRAN